MHLVFRREEQAKAEAARADSSVPPPDSAYGLEVRLPAREARVEIETCARCHSRRAPLWRALRRGSLTSDMATIGVLTMDMRLDYSQSLKDKRHAVKGLKDRLRHRFNVAVAEIDCQDLWQRAGIGIVTISTSQAHAEQELAAVADEIERTQDIPEPVLTALQITEQIVPNLVVKEALVKTRDAVTDGKSLAQPLAQSKIFPQLMIDLIKIGEV